MLKGPTREARTFKLDTVGNEKTTDVAKVFTTGCV